MLKPKIYLKRAMRRLFPNRRYKDALFRRVFQDKRDLLDLYNALNRTNYTDPDMIEITTLEDAIYMSMKDDLSFIVASSLNLYEHQSTVNPNMPLRGLLYLSTQYQTFVQKNKADIYGRKLISLPFPQFVIFYNGIENQEDEVILKLSDAFPKNSDGLTPALECTARVLNINAGHNEILQNTCKRLHDYSFFISKINDFSAEGIPLDLAITAAIDYCIDEGILADILEKCRDEVFDMLLTEYDAKFHEDNIRKEEREEGRQEGRREGILLAQTEIIINALNSGMTESEITEKLLIPQETIEAVKEEMSKNKTK